MGYDYDKQLISFLQERSKEGMAIAILGPRKSAQVKPPLTIPYLMTTEIGQQTERDKTKTDREAPTRDRDEQGRGKYLREQNQHVASWKMLKDRLLCPNSCNKSQCPTIKERLELHHLEIHGETYGKSGSSRHRCGCKTRLEMNLNLHQNKLSDKSMPQNVSAFSINADKTSNILNKYQIGVTYKTNRILKYQDVSIQHSKEDIEEVVTSFNKSSKEYADNSTKLDINSLENMTKNDFANNCNDFPKKLEQQEHNALEFVKHSDIVSNSPRCADFCTSPYDFNLLNKNKKKCVSASCDVSLNENYTTTYSSLFTDKFLELKCPLYPRKKKFDQIEKINSPGNDSILMLDNSNSAVKRSEIMIDEINSPAKRSEMMIDKSSSARKCSEIMIDKINSPTKGSVMMIDKCNSAQSDMHISKDTNTDISEPSNSKTCSTANDSNFNSHVNDNSLSCAMEIYKHESYKNQDSSCCENLTITNYTTSNNDAFTDDINDSVKFPLCPLNKDLNKICVRSNIEQNVDRPSYQSNANNTSTPAFEIVHFTPDVKHNDCYTTFEASQCAVDFVTTYSVGCIANIEAYDMALVPRRVSFNQTNSKSYGKREKRMINNSSSMQLVLNVPENKNAITSQSNSSERCIDNVYTTQIDNPIPLEKLSDDNSSSKLKCACDDLCSSTDSNDNNDIKTIPKYLSVTCEESVVNNNSETSNTVSIFATQTEHSTPNGTVYGDCCMMSDKPACTDKIIPNETVYGDCCKMSDKPAYTNKITSNERDYGECCKKSDKPRCIDKTTDSFSDTLINAIKSLLPLLPIKGNLNHMEMKPCINVSEKINTNECKFSTPNKSNESLRSNKSQKSLKKVHIKACECSDNYSASSKKLKLVDKSAGSNSSIRSRKSPKNLKKCSKSPTDSNSINFDKNIPSNSDIVCNIKKCHSKLSVTNSDTINRRSGNFDRCPIFKEVKEWILGVPVNPAIEKETKEGNNEAINDLVKKLKKLSKEADNPKYDEKVRKEIDSCLSKISISYPGEKNEKRGFKRCLGHRLFQRLKTLNKNNVGTTCSVTKRRSSFSACKLNFSCQILSKDVEIRIAIREWLRKITKNNNMTENHLSQLADFVNIRISPLLNIPVSMYNHKIILKAAIADVMSDLSIGDTSWYESKDVQIHNHAKDLADKLLCIQTKYSSGKKNSNITTNRYSELKNCIDLRESAICTEIKKCFEDASVEPADVLVEEVGVILMDCYEIPHPQAERDAKKEIVNILVTSTNITESQASRLAKNVMKKVRKVLNAGELKTRYEASNYSRQSQNTCTVLVCTIEPSNPLCYKNTIPKA